VAECELDKFEVSGSSPLRPIINFMPQSEFYYSVVNFRLFLIFLILGYFYTAVVPFQINFGTKKYFSIRIVLKLQEIWKVMLNHINKIYWTILYLIIKHSDDIKKTLLWIYIIFRVCLIIEFYWNWWFPPTVVYCHPYLFEHSLKEERPPEIQLRDKHNYPIKYVINDIDYMFMCQMMDHDFGNAAKLFYKEEVKYLPEYNDFYLYRSIHAVIITVPVNNGMEFIFTNDYKPPVILNPDKIVGNIQPLKYKHGDLKTLGEFWNLYQHKKSEILSPKFQDLQSIENVRMIPYLKYAMGGHFNKLENCVNKQQPTVIFPGEGVIKRVGRDVGQTKPVPYLKYAMGGHFNIIEHCVTRSEPKTLNLTNWNMNQPTVVYQGEGQIKTVVTRGPRTPIDLNNLTMTPWEQIKPRPYYSAGPSPWWEFLEYRKKEPQRRETLNLVQELVRLSKLEYDCAVVHKELISRYRVIMCLINNHHEISERCGGLHDPKRENVTIYGVTWGRNQIAAIDNALRVCDNTIVRAENELKHLTYLERYIKMKGMALPRECIETHYVHRMQKAGKIAILENAKSALPYTLQSQNTSNYIIGGLVSKINGPISNEAMADQSIIRKTIWRYYEEELDENPQNHSNTYDEHLAVAAARPRRIIRTLNGQ
jgi:hypothetical protein